jgi:Subtilase family
MSWTLSDKASEDPQMRKIVSDAILDAKKRIVFSAVGDKGTTAEYSYPADFQNVTGISTTSIGGVDPPTAESNKAVFSLPGEDLETPMPTYLRQGLGKVKGSSAATALAAGLASLILTLVRFAYYKEDKARSSKNERAERYFRDFRDPNNMMRVFRKMCVSTEHKKFVQPWTAFPNASELEKMDFDRFKETLVTYFDAALRK